MTTKQPESSRLQQSRRAAVTSAADLFEGIAQVKRLHRRAFPDNRSEEERKPGKGDLLFDLVRLNVDYLNRLTELSRSHRDLANRTLERFYSIVAPRIPGSEFAELTFGTTAETWQRTFVVENKLDNAVQSAHITCTDFQGPMPSKPFAVVVSFEVEGRPLPDGLVELKYARPITVTVRVPSHRFPAGKLFSAEVIVLMAGRTRRIPVTVDTRAGQP